jgi:beta-alanine--pyruvate transaminase
MNPINRISLDEFWMPFTANRQFKAAPRLLSEASGMYYRDEDGRRILDATAGLWCVNAGHGRKEIASAVADQLFKLDYAPTFQMGHPLAFRFAEELAKIAPFGLDRIFFTNSGSESVDTALKIALAYQRAIGQGTRTRLIGRERGYHGSGFGGISVGGLVNNRRTFGTLHGTDHIRHTHDAERNRFCIGLPEYGAEIANDLQRLVDLHGAETIAAVIVEPVAGSAGVLAPPQGYLQKLRDIATQNGILLIFDEVITGFGRLGTPFAANYFGVVPDIMTTAKGLTNGCFPMGAVFANRALYEALMTGPENAIELFHGYTYSGHPGGCAAGLATLDIYSREGLLTRGQELGDYWRDAMLSLRDARHVTDIRALGLVAGIELQSRPGAYGGRAYEAFVQALQQGLLIRVTGEIIALSPPLIVEKSQIDTIVSMIRDILNELA